MCLFRGGLGMPDAACQEQEDGREQAVLGGILLFWAICLFRGGLGRGSTRGA
jgi:hypothetical protein